MLFNLCLLWQGCVRESLIAHTHRAWEWFQQQLQIATDNASREHDPANIGKTYEVLVQRLMSNGVQCQFASGKVVNMSLAEASLEPVRCVLAG